MEIQKISVEKLKPNSWNPNRMADKQYKSLVKEIKKRGFLQPLLVRKKDDYYEIIDGEHRWKAAKEAGLKEVEAVVLRASDETAKILTLNMNHLRGEDDVMALAEVVRSLGENFSDEQLVEELHIGKDELDALLDVEEDFNFEELPDKNEQEKKKIVCPNCGFEFEI